MEPHQGGYACYGPDFFRVAYPKAAGGDGQRRLLPRPRVERYAYHTFCGVLDGGAEAVALGLRPIMAGCPH